MTKDESLKMAIEALEESLGIIINSKGDGTNYDVNVAINISKRTIQACKEAIAQPAQEPDFWMKDMVLYYYKPDDTFKYTPLYTHPTPSWQGLSDDDVNEIIDNLNNPFAMIRVAEMHLKEKNT